MTYTTVNMDAKPVTSAESVQRLAGAVRERMEQLDIKQADIPRLGGPSEGTLRGLFAAAKAKKPYVDFQVATLRKLDRPLRWEVGSSEDLLAGGRPRPLPDSGDAHVVRVDDALEGAVRLVVPAEVAEAHARMTPLQRAEAEADLVARLLAKMREFGINDPA